MSNFKTYVSEYGIRIDPAINIKINGSKIKRKYLKLIKLELDLSAGNQASLCSVELQGKSSINYGKLELSDEINDSKIGTKIEIELGFKDGNDKDVVKSVFVGYIFSFGVEINQLDNQKLTINAMDGKIWLMPNVRTELKKDKQKYSDIVRQTLNNYSSIFAGSEVSISGEPQLKKSICQREESDYDFLCRLADLTGCLFYVSLGKIFFTNASKYKNKSITIEPGSGVRNVRFNANLIGIPKDVSVTKIDEKDFSKSVSTKSSILETIGSGDTASEHSNKISSKQSVTLLDNTAITPELAKFIAEAELSKRNLNFVSCYVETILFPDAVLGTGIQLKKFGKPIDNSYVITNIKHIVDPNNSKTLLTLSASSYSVSSFF